jgi:cytoskeletal protein RodZ
MADGGHLERWMPLMQDVVAAAEYVGIYAQDIDTADENAQAAASSEQAAATSATNAAQSATAAATSATNAAQSATAAASSVIAAHTSEQAAATSATNAATSAYTAQNAAATALTAPGTAATSTTSLTLSTGSKTLTIQAGKSLVVGMSVKIAHTADPVIWLHGDITAYNSSTGVLTVQVGVSNGSGTYSAWTVSVSAPVKPIAGRLADGTEITLW